ncbi:unnamed protein product, partial [marine sediment metagenome]
MSDKETGDGTTSSVIIAGELLKKGGELLNKKVHASLIVDGYKAASTKAQEILVELAQKMEPFQNGNKVLQEIAMTALHSKAVHSAKDAFAQIAVDSIKRVADEDNGNFTVDLDNIKIIQKTGKSLAASELIEGVIIDKEVVHPASPRSSVLASLRL